MTAPLLPTHAGEVQPAAHPARPGCVPNPTGKAVSCPICGAAVTVDAQFTERECGHALLLTAAGVLVGSVNVHATRRKLSVWAYGSLAKAPGSEWRGAIVEGSVALERKTEADLA